MKGKKSIVLIMLFYILITSLSTAVFSFANDNKKEITITLKGKKGATVFELLKKNHKIEYTSSEMGVYITSIDGITSSGKKYWTYLVNGKPVPVSADKLVVSDGDKIQWVYK